VRVTKNQRLTDTSYDRNVFHIEFDTTGTGLRYEIGDALGVHGHNDAVDTKAFLALCGFGCDEQIEALRQDGRVAVSSVLQAFTQVVDIFGRPPRRFYGQLGDLCSDPAERDALLWWGAPWCATWVLPKSWGICTFLREHWWIPKRL
jgi:sulfite reductase (NADPH) flavoprotein alpha-component